MKRYALYLGCVIPTEQYAYEASLRSVLHELGVELVDMDNASCCGLPVRSVNVYGWLYLSARNLAIAEQLGLNLLSPCNGCHLSLCEVKHYLNEDSRLKAWVNGLLEEEGLKYRGGVEVKHTVDALHDDVGVNVIAKQVRRRLEGLKLAAHYGCHILRPSRLKRVDDPEDPVKLESLLKALGVEAPNYPERLDCCGGGLLIPNAQAALSMAGAKLKAVKLKGFDGLVTVCPACQKMLDAKQAAAGQTVGFSVELPVVYYVQLLGLALGVDQAKLGLQLNQSPIDNLLAKA